jgi:hypothetical protein
MIKLFYAVNTCSLASHIALEEAGAEYSTVNQPRPTSSAAPNISPSIQGGAGHGHRQGHSD